MCICTCAYTYMLVWKNVCIDRAKQAGWCMQYLTNSLTSKAVRCVHVCAFVGVRVCVCGWVCVCACMCCLCACVYSRNPFLFLIPFSCSRTSFFSLCLSRPLSCSLARSFSLSSFLTIATCSFLSLSPFLRACPLSLFLVVLSLFLYLSTYICARHAHTLSRCTFVQYTWKIHIYTYTRTYRYTIIYTYDLYLFMEEHKYVLDQCVRVACTYIRREIEKEKENDQK